MKINEIYAGIVSYNPNIDRLNQNLKSVTGQVSEVIIIDNGSKNVLKIEKLLKYYNNVSLLCLNNNFGIAYALNKAMKYGMDNNYAFMLTLDQDSICSDRHVNKLGSLFNISDFIGIVAPSIFDDNVGIIGHKIKENYRYVNTCISSGSIVKIDVWNKIGGYDEYMFIDSVDFDFCYRLRKSGFKILQSGIIVLNHELGKSKKVRFLFFYLNFSEHSSFRNYYISRNNLYYPLKNNLYFHFVRGIVRNIVSLFLILLYSDKKKAKLHSVMRGTLDGITFKNTKK